MSQFKSQLKHDALLILRGAAVLVIAAILAAIAQSAGLAAVAEFIPPAAVGGVGVYLFDRRWPKHLENRGGHDS